MQKPFVKLAILVIIIVGFFGKAETLSAQDAMPTAGQQVEAMLKTSDGGEVPYLVYLPKNFKRNVEQESAEQKFAMVFFLHGRGESNGPLSIVAKWGPPKFAERGDDLPFVIVSPQCPPEDSWPSETQQSRLTELLDHAIKEYNIDQSQIFLTGLSMGGYGSWTMAAKHPNRFAAVAPVCGGGNPSDADKLKDVPIWAFHGDQDRAVPFSKSVEMVDAIKAAGGTKIRFTSLEHLGHNCWSAVYATPDLYSWMRQQAKKKD